MPHPRFESAHPWPERRQAALQRSSCPGQWRPEGPWGTRGEPTPDPIPEGQALLRWNAKGRSRIELGGDGEAVVLQVAFAEASGQKPPSHGTGVHLSFQGAEGFRRHDDHGARGVQARQGALRGNSVDVGKEMQPRSCAGSERLAGQGGPKKPPQCRYAPRP